MTSAARLLRHGFLTLVAGFMVLPVAIVAGVSLNRQPLMTFPPRQPGLRWYAAFLADDGWRDALMTSLAIGVAVAVLCIALALPIAFSAWRRQTWLTRLVSALAAMPLMLPAVVLAVVFMVFWRAVGHPGHVENTVLSQAIVFLPMPLAIITLGFGTIPRSIVEAARTLGARERDIFSTIVLPVVWPYLCSAGVFVFISSINEYIIAYMTSGFTVTTLPIKVFDSLRMGFQPTMCVGAVLFMLLGVVCFGAIGACGNLPNLMGGRE
ncbi:ABC transporter permease [Paraburkholderia sp. XV]|uniref:ABC transporter permease n=1 Tax=Paraburkholderia sp. XV TaxID=2831520 RepID=UPI001CD3EC31|nr:ABC transporter permease [Paraburkholderia sp. XV]